MESMTKITTGQLHRILEGAIVNGMNCLIVGSPGIGKSEIVESVTKKLGYDLWLTQPVTSDPIDYKGIPYVKNGKAEYLLDSHLQRLIDADRPMVAFADDIGQAPAGVQAALMQLIQARRLNGKEISKHVTWVAATNRRQDGSGVTGILEALKSRFRPIVELEPDLTSWTDWALNNNMPAELIAFLRFRPDLLNAPAGKRADMANFPCPRTICAVGTWMNTGCMEPSIAAPIIAGCVGDGFAHEFLTFLDVWKELPSLTAIVLNPTTTPVPPSNKPSAMYAIAGMLAKNASEDNFEALTIYSNRLPTEFGVLFMKDAIRQHPEVCNTKAFLDWSIKHSDVL